MCLKTENCCLKTYAEIRVDEKICENKYNIILNVMLFKNWKLLFENTN